MPVAESPMVSIVMPSYNHGRFVGEAIRSVLNQTMQDFEIVITDDASRDNTVDMIRQFDDRRIRLETFTINRGGVVALNSAIRRSRGAFLCYLASDDYFLPNKLARQLDFFAKHPEVAAVFGLPNRVNEEGKPLPKDSGFDIPFSVSDQSRVKWLRHLFFRSNSLCHPTAMIRRETFDSVGLFDPRFWGLPDFEMWVRICLKFEIRALREPLSAFRIMNNAGNISAPRRDSKLRDAFEFFQTLKHYRTMDAALMADVFAEDIRALELSAETPPLIALAEVALRGTRPGHQLFALETMYEGLAGTEGSHRLVELIGSVDAFRIFAEKDLVAKMRAFGPLRPPGSVPTRAPAGPKIGRNDFCSCGSGRKFKHCHGALR